MQGEREHTLTAVLRDKAWWTQTTTLYPGQSPPKPPTSPFSTPLSPDPPELLLILLCYILSYTWEPILSGEAYRVLPCHCPSRLGRQRPPIPFIIGCHTPTMLGSDSPSDEDGVLCAGVPPLLEPWQASS